MHESIGLDIKDIIEEDGIININGSISDLDDYSKWIEESFNLSKDIKEFKSISIPSLSSLSFIDKIDKRLDLWCFCILRQAGRPGYLREFGVEVDESASGARLLAMQTLSSTYLKNFVMVKRLPVSSFHI